MSGASISYPHQVGHSVLTAGEQTRQSRTELRSANTDMATCYPPYELSTPQPSRTVSVPVQKDYSRPLHVDCSVEYELPNQAKPPVGVRNEPLLMIHPCYFRKIESQRRSPFVNNLPTRQPSAAKRRAIRGQQIPQQVPQQAAQYPVQYTTDRQQLWEPMPPLVPISTAQSYCKRDPLVSGCGTYSSGSDSGHWTDPDRSPDRPEDKHILSGKYRQYLRAHRLHPYVTSAIPIASTFPQIQQVCYNVWSLWCDTEPLVIIVCNEKDARMRLPPGVVVIQQLCSLRPVLFCIGFHLTFSFFITISDVIPFLFA